MSDVPVIQEEHNPTELQIEMARFVRDLKKKLWEIKADELTQWLDHIEALSIEGKMTQDELAWLDRVHTNMVRRILPILDNLDQVRWTLDKKQGGEGDVETAGS